MVMPPETAHGQANRADGENATAQDRLDGRTRSSARSRAALLDAAMTEFADHGFSGARVAVIARRAGVNQQLISYHFGGKRGLYDALQQQWLEREREFRAESETLGDLAVRYLRAAAGDPRGARLSARWLLDGGAGGSDRANSEELADLDTRQRAGEIDPELETRALLLAIIGMVSAPMLVPGVAAELIGDDLGHYEQQLRLILGHLAVTPVGPDASGPGEATGIDREVSERANDR